jgi:hypothetical protein
MKKLLFLALIFFISHPTHAQTFFGPANQISKISIAKPEYFDASDLDSDGDLDALIVSRGTESLFWLENLDGQGNFGNPTELVTGIPQPSNALGVDLDGDGDQDIVQAVWQTEELFWLENMGGGTFSDPQMIDDYANGIWRVRAADVDGDGDQDLLSAEREGHKVLWYENTDGQGTFSMGNIIHEGADNSNIRDAYPVDMDNDGDMDVVSADWNLQKVVWYENTDGAGTFSNEKLISDSIDDINIIFCRDFDNDGLMDVLARDRTDVFWLRNMDGGTTFSGPNNISQGETIVDYFPTDFDGDNDEDLLVVNTYWGNLGWFKNNGNGTFAPLTIIGNDIGGCDFIHAADLDGDGDPEFIGMAWLKSWVYFHENEDGNGTTQIPKYIAKSEISGPIDMTLADLNGDSDLEIVLASRFEHKLYLYERAGRDGAYTDIMELPGFVLEPRSIFTGDVDGDGKTDVLSGSFNEGALYWSRNMGNNQFGTPKKIGELTNSTTDVTAADMDGDGDLDVMGTSLYSNELVLFENYGSGNFGNAMVISDQLGGAFAAITGDFNNDQKPDIAVASRYADKISVFENQGNLTFAAEKIIDEDMNGVRTLVAGDFDKDGDLDIASANYDYVKWYRNEFGRADFTVIEISTNDYFQDINDIECKDVNGDGNLDLFIAPEDRDFAAWFMNTGGDPLFTQQINIGKGLNEPAAIAFDDVDRDGRMDVILASVEDNKINWFRNELYPVFLSQPQDVTICNDGEVKFIATTDKADAYRWQISEPYTSWFDDMENDEVYSGVNSNELTIKISGPYLNLARYRLVATYLGEDFYSDPALLTVDRLIEANAGYNVETCYTSINFYANDPGNGTGLWSVVQGAGVFSHPTDAYTQVSGMQNGINIYKWTITNGSCISEDEVQLIKHDSIAMNVPVESMTIDKGDPVTISVEITGDVKNILWYKDGYLVEDGDGVSGATTAVLTIASVDENDEGNYNCEVFGECNYIYSPTIEVLVSTVGIQDLSLEQAELYPNPVKDLLYIESPVLINSFELYNEQGSQLDSEREIDKTEFNLNTEGLPSGAYFVLLKAGDQIKLLRFVK